jgi:hypothetical protein
MTMGYSLVNFLELVGNPLVNLIEVSEGIFCHGLQKFVTGCHKVLGIHSEKFIMGYWQPLNITHMYFSEDC